jgi:curli biogenesis system outer membrane secretion channel CsgG
MIPTKTDRYQGRPREVAVLAALAGFVALGSAAAPRVAGTAPVPTVAVLDFGADDPARPDLGAEIANGLAAMLSSEPGLKLVERSAILKLLDEQALGRSGMVDPGQAARIGRLVGAKILVSGKAFTMGRKSFIVAKLIGTETSLVEGVLITAPVGTDFDELLGELGKKVASKLRQVGSALVAADQPPTDRLPALRSRLAGRARPKLTLVVTEYQAGSPSSAPIDPAVETELARVLSDAGFEVGGRARDAAFQVQGTATSEFGMRVGNLVSCAARAELRVTDLATGRVVFSDRVTTRGVDLSEQIAGKTALQEAGQELAVRLLAHFAETLPPARGR